MAESETMSIDTSNEAQDDPLQDLSYDKLEEIVETTLWVSQYTCTVNWQNSLSLSLVQIYAILLMRLHSRS